MYGNDPEFYQVVVKGGTYNGGAWAFSDLSTAHDWAIRAVGHNGCTVAIVQCLRDSWLGGWRTVCRYDMADMLAAMAGD